MKNIYLLKRNLGQMLFIVFLFTVQAFTLVNAQSVPTPIYSFPLDGNNPANWIGQGGTSHTGVTGGTLSPTIDRFGISNGATEFNHDAYLFQGDSWPAIPQTEDVTISFWAKLNTSHSYPSGYNPYNPGVTEKGRFFSLTTDYKSGGVARIKDNALLGVERTVDVGGNIKPWYLWLNKPAMLEQAGWYQVVMVAAQNYTKVYIYKPDGSKACSYNYMGSGDFSKRLAIGKKASFPASQEFVSSAFIMDDFKFWEVALTEQQVDELHNQEAPIQDGAVYKIAINPDATGSTKQYVQTAYHSVDNSANIEIYPMDSGHYYNYLWQAVKQPNGNFYFKMFGTNKFFQTSGHGTGSSTRIDLYEMEQGYESKYEWRLDKQGTTSDGRYHIRMGDNISQYVQTAYHSFSSSANIEIYPYDASHANNYVWQFERVTNTEVPITEGVFEIALGKTATQSYPKYFETSNHGLGEGTQLSIFQMEDEYRYNYNWHLIKGENNTYKIKIYGTNRFLTTGNSYSLSSGTTTEIYNINNPREFNYLWVLEPVPNTTDEYYIRTHAAENMYIATGDGFSSSNGADINIYEKNTSNENNFRWKFRDIKQDNLTPFADNSTFNLIYNPNRCTPTKGARMVNGNSRAVLLDFNIQPHMEIKMIKNNLTNSYRMQVKQGSSYSNTYFCTGSGHSYSGGTGVEPHPVEQDYEYNYEWAIEPDDNNPNLFRIKALGSNKYWAPGSGFSCNNYTSINIYNYSSPNAESYLWEFLPFSSNSAKSSNIKANNTELLGTDESINIYPNPSNGTLNISLNLEQSDTVNFDFYNLQGRQIYSENRKITQGNQTVILKDLKTQGFSENQLYLLKITTSTGKVMTSKVLFE